MAKAKSRRPAGQARRDAESRRRAKGLRDIINDGTALQVELLGAGIKVWSTMFETMAAYVKTSSEEIVGLTNGGDANAVVDRVMRSAREKLTALTTLPEEATRNFAKKVRARAKR